MEVPVKYSVFVKEGDRVKAGDKLIEFDMDSFRPSMILQNRKEIAGIGSRKSQGYGKKGISELSVGKHLRRRLQVELADNIVMKI